jgi:hypothetical protein
MLDAHGLDYVASMVGKWAWMSLDMGESKYCRKVYHIIKIFIWTVLGPNHDLRGEKPAIIFGVSYEYNNQIRYCFSIRHISTKHKAVKMF